MTSGDYRLLSDWINAGTFVSAYRRDGNVYVELDYAGDFIGRLVRTLKADNPNFDAASFIRATGYSVELVDGKSVESGTKEATKASASMNDDDLEAKSSMVLKEEMDDAITSYIAACTGTDAMDVDYSYINQDIDDAIEMLGGEPARAES